MTLDLTKLGLRAATIDELLSGSYQAEVGQKDTTDLAALRLAAWARASASGNWGLFFKRLKRDGLSVDEILSKFANVRQVPHAKSPTWVDDANWIFEALTGEIGHRPSREAVEVEPLPFEKLFYSLLNLAEKYVYAILSNAACARLDDSAKADLRGGLLKLLTDLYAPLLYSKFVTTLKSQTADGKLPASAENAGTEQVDALIESLRTRLLSEIFEEKPVLLRLTATIVRQWIDTSSELIYRLDSDIVAIKTLITGSAPEVKVHAIGGDLSDPHNFGHSVQILTFSDKTKIVYKPKDLQLDVAWHDLIQRFNASAPPVDLKPVKTIAKDGYGWTEFISHTECESEQDIELFYRRAGAWLAVFHLFASSDMHYENILAHGAHPVPIDLEMILQSSTPEAEQKTPETEAAIEASQRLNDSVLMVGMLPSYAKTPNNKIFDAGGLNAVKSSAPVGIWKNINTDGMRWMQTPSESIETPNIPYADGKYAMLGDYLPSFIDGFKLYGHFLISQRDVIGVADLLDAFKKLPVRKVIRNTRFYYMLLQRLKDHRTMSDGVTWSAQAEFLSRLADWDSTDDVLWHLQEAERLALVNLNVPHFVAPSDQDLIAAVTGHSTQTGGKPGLEQSAERWANWCEAEVERQVEIIQVSTSFVSKSESNKEEKYLFKRTLKQPAKVQNQACLAKELSRITQSIRQFATIKEQSAAWVGLDWLGDSDVAQLVTVGSDLYNGSSGIALYLAAYARYAEDSMSRELALKALALTRRQVTQPSAARWARSMGVGGASGLGSLVYALTVISDLLEDSTLLDDALSVAQLFSDELIAADRSLDVIGGSAGGILGLLALHRRTQSSDVLAKAIACGQHLLDQPRPGEIGKRSWVGMGMDQAILTGFSHGAAGFAYALSRLAVASGRDDFAQAAQECLAYEDSCYNEHLLNWPDLRSSEDGTVWPSQWCHGAVGIGLARIASNSSATVESESMMDDIRNSVKNATTKWPQHIDTLCCGTLGTIELLGEASKLFNQPDLRELSDQRLAQIIASREEKGDYAWNAGGTSVNLGMFRGLSGVGYTILRRVDPSLPNILVWE